MVEDQFTNDVIACPVNIGVTQGSRLSCNAFNGVQDSVLKRITFILAKQIQEKRPDLALRTIKDLNDLLAFADDTLIMSQYLLEIRRSIEAIKIDIAKIGL